MAEDRNVYFKGNCEDVKGNHNGMPSRTSDYEVGDERGHVQASSLGGSNDRSNIVPQHHDVNRGAYKGMEMGEKQAVHNGYQVETEKIAVTDTEKGNRPTTFIVNDVVTAPNGEQQELHHSFANLSYEEQEQLNEALNEHVDMPDVENPNDSLREMMTADEYAELMEATDAELSGLKGEYACFTPMEDVVSDETVVGGIEDVGGEALDGGGIDIAGDDGGIND